MNIYSEDWNNQGSRNNLQSAWWFHTASTKSILNDLFSIRDDAETRLGDVGLGCTITSVLENYGDDNTTLRVIQGTITTPQYLETEYARSPMVRSQEETHYSLKIEKSISA